MRYANGPVWASMAALIVAFGMSSTWAQDDPAAPAGADDPALAAAMEEGERVFSQNCKGCHGKGEVVTDNPALSSVGGMLIQIIEGGERMPAFGKLSDPQIAAVATYVRNSFGNAHGIVTEADVAEWRM